MRPRATTAPDISRALTVALAIALTFLMVTLVTASAGCGSDGTADATATADDLGGSPPTGAARYDIMGSVQRLDVDASVSAQEQGIVGAMLVVAPDGDTTSAYDQASVAITTETRIWRSVGEGAEELTIDDLSEGDMVIVQFTGPVAESYPVQATAGSIEILGG